MFKRSLTLSLLCCISLNCSKEKTEQKTTPTPKNDSEFIETLDGKKITTDDFKKAYETAIDSISRIQKHRKKKYVRIYF